MKVPISARIEVGLAEYLESYRQQCGIKSRSEALEEAIKALRDRELKQEYALAMDEWQASGEQELWERTAADGLEHDEAW